MKCLPHKLGILKLTITDCLEILIQFKKIFQKDFFELEIVLKT